MSRNRIVVCGSTGNQGSAVVRALLKKGNCHVVALTRNIYSEQAQLCRMEGAEVIYADHRDQSSLASAFRNAWGIFAVTQPGDDVKGRYDINSEMIQAKNIIWASREAGVSRLIYSSFINPLNERTSCSFVDSKLTIESMIIKHNLPYTILRLPLFMEHIPIPDPEILTFIGNFRGDLRVP
jgi:uncharacterized protein YbjT (DUF2867 family)